MLSIPTISSAVEALARKVMDTFEDVRFTPSDSEAIIASEYGSIEIMNQLRGARVFLTNKRLVFITRANPAMRRLLPYLRHGERVIAIPLGEIQGFRDLGRRTAHPWPGMLNPMPFYSVTEIRLQDGTAIGAQLSNVKKVVGSLKDLGFTPSFEGN